MNLKKIQNTLYEHAPKEKYKPLFFKTGPGSYSEHDEFIGVSTPILKKIAKEGSALSFSELEMLLKSKVNEERLLALLILIERYKETNCNLDVYDFFMSHLQYVNNWNLVDVAAPHIVGKFLLDKDKTILLKLAKSSVLWERRIAIVSTYHFIKNGYFDYTLKIAEILMHDSEDLIHKAVGWMLREVGKKEIATLEVFLNEFAHIMPRTMLRYAIEKFPKDVRDIYLNKRKLASK